LELLKQKWAAAKVAIDSVTFEFHNPNAPLSWHLTPEETKAIQDSWTDDMADCRRQVKEFLS